MRMASWNSLRLTWARRGDPAMSYVWLVLRFDGFDWRPLAGSEYVTQSAAAREAYRLGRDYPNDTFRVQRTRPGFLSQFVQRVA